MKVGDLVKMDDKHAHVEVMNSLGAIYDESEWRGIIVRHVGACQHQYDDDDCNNEWEVHWLHNPPNETSFEYGYYLEVISESG